MNDLGTLEVGFDVNLNNLTSGFDSAKSQATNTANAIVDSNDMVLASYDELASGVQSAMSSVTDDTVSASSALDEMAGQGGAAGSDLIGVLGEILDAINALRETTIDASNGVTDSLLHIENATKDVGYSVDAMSSSVTGGLDDLYAQFGSISVEATSSAEAIAQAGSAASEAGRGGFMSLFNEIGIGIFNIQNMINTATQLTSALLGPAASAEEVTSSLEIFTGSAAKARQELADLASFASHTPFETSAIDEAALKMQSVGISAHDVIPYIQSLGDALDATGRISSADLDQIVTAFDKIKTQGHLTTEVMNSFALAGIDAWSVLEKQTGKTHDQLADLISKGLYPADQAMRDLTEGIEKSPIYKGQMANDANLITGAISTLKSNWDQILAAFGSPIIKALEPLINNLSADLSSPGFKQFAGSVGQGIVTVFQDIGNAVSQTSKFLASLDFKDLTHSFAQLGDAVGQVSRPLLQLGSNKEVTTFFSGLKADLAGGLNAAIKDTSRFVSDLASDLTKLGSNKELTSFLGALRDGFSQVQHIVGGELGKDFQSLGQTAQNLGKWFQTDMVPAIHAAEPGFTKLGSVLATDVAPALAQIWSVGQQLARDALPPLTKAFEKIEPVVVRVGGFLADKLADGLHTITPDIVSASKSIGQFASDIETRAEPILDGLSTDLKTFLDWIGPYWPSIWDHISSDFTMVWDILKGVVQIGWSLISGIIKVGLDIMSGNWKKAWEDVKSTFSGIWDGIKSIASGVWSGIGGGIKAGINGVIDLINNFINSLDSLSVDIGPVHIHPAIPHIPHLATGGIVAPGDMAIVGDPGPNEEIVLGGTSGATVLSNSQSSTLLAGLTRAAAPATTTQEIHVHVYLDGTEMTDQIGRRLVSTWLNHGPAKTLRSA